jgi:hypothetical protein
MLMDLMKQLNLMPILTGTTITIPLTRNHIVSERCCILNDLALTCFWNPECLKKIEVHGLFCFKLQAERVLYAGIRKRIF